MITFFAAIGALIFGFCMLAAMDGGYFGRTIIHMVFAAACVAVVF